MMMKRRKRLEELLSDLSAVEKHIAKKKAYLRLLQARREFTALESQIANTKTCGNTTNRTNSGNKAGALGSNDDAVQAEGLMLQQWKPNLRTPASANSEQEISDEEARWPDSHLSGVEISFWRPREPEPGGEGTQG